MKKGMARVEDPGRRMIREALRACKPHFGAVLLFSAAMHLLYLAPSLYMMQVYDRVLATRGIATLIFLSVILLACLGTLAYLDSIRSRLMATASRRIDRLLAPKVLSASLIREGRAAAGPAQPLREFDTMRMMMAGPAALALIDLPWAPLYIAVCFMIHPAIGALALAGGLILMLLALANEFRMRNPIRVQEDANATAYALQHGDAQQYETAQALGMRPALVRRQLGVRKASTYAGIKTGKVSADFNALTKFFRLALQSAALGLGAFLAVEQQISAGAIIACTILTSRAFAPLEQVVSAWRQVIQGMRSYRVVIATLASASEAQHTALPTPKGRLSVEAVSVRSPAGEGLLLRGVTFTAEPGEILGVVGPSGAGKTTLMRIISGAMPPDDGAVRIDGARIADWDPDRLGASIGYLPQEVGLFSGTIAQNIARFTGGDAPDPELDHAIVAAAVAAGAHELILRLPKGYDTVIGVGGRGVSAGQAQRIGLARALFRDPALIILDEPNAHLDSEGEAALIEALKAARERGAAIVVVAHRAGFMGAADKLLVIRDGRVEHFGPREQVMTRLQGGAPRPVVVAAQGGDGGRS